jgi:hypothetical protein
MMSKGTLKLHTTAWPSGSASLSTRSWNTRSAVPASPASATALRRAASASRRCAARASRRRRTRWAA